MNTIQQTCGNCAGTGIYSIWVFDDQWDDDLNGYGTAHIEKTECTRCGGKGYTEYTVFTIEEAEAILKHCGIEDI